MALTDAGEDQVAEVAQHGHEGELAVIDQLLPGGGLVALGAHQRLPGLWHRQLHALAGARRVERALQTAALEGHLVGGVLLAQDAHHVVGGRRDVQLTHHLLHGELALRWAHLHLAALALRLACQLAGLARLALELALTTVLAQLVGVELDELVRERLAQRRGQRTTVQIAFGQRLVERRHVQPVGRQPDQFAKVLLEEGRAQIHVGGQCDQKVGRAADVEVVAHIEGQLEHELGIALCHLLHQHGDHLGHLIDRTAAAGARRSGSSRRERALNKLATARIRCRLIAWSTAIEARSANERSTDHIQEISLHLVEITHDDG
mmetsp:Transcript_17840/g.53580  ORF Transcript_17840/g.53580 Transcript_17840/m.53580 type:complete len:320 (-) Transcript_17840:280-1239(-)